MLVKTQGIVISYIRYRETSIIVRVFTRELGLRSYLVNSVRSSGKKTKMAFFQPLTLLDLVVYEKENAGIQRISESKLGMSFHRIPFDFYRSGMAMFMSEILGKSLIDNYQNEPFFDFLAEAIALLDREDSPLAHFASSFLLESSKYLGFAPDNALSFFEELQENMLQQMDFTEEIRYLEKLLDQPFCLDEKIAGSIRRNLLDHLLLFYSKHLDHQGEWKSIKVLRQMM